MRQLMSSDWPGNVRELENAIECAVALSSEPVLHAEDLPSNIQFVSAQCLSFDYQHLPLDEIERRAILQALRETAGDRLAAARILGIGKTTLYRKLKEYARDPTAPTAACI